LFEYPEMPVPSKKRMEYAMSADNGVYILVSRGRRTQRGHKKEYRVVHAQAIECIREQPDYPNPMVRDSEFNREMLLQFFGTAWVFSDIRLAEGYALGIYDQWMRDIGVVEYGIVLLDECAHIPFPRPRIPKEARRPAKMSVAS
jgi:hypothetical protein